MDDDFGGALGELSGSEPDSDAGPAEGRGLLDGDEEDGAGDEFGGIEEDDDADGLFGGVEGDTSDDDDGEEGPEPSGGGSDESEPETRAERQSRRLDKLKCEAFACSGSG